MFNLHRNAMAFKVVTTFLRLMSRVRHPVISLDQRVPTTVQMLASTRHLVRLASLPLRRQKRSIHLRKGLNVHVRKIDCACPRKDGTILSSFACSFGPNDLATVIKRAKIKGDALVELVLTLLHPSEKSVMFCGKRRRIMTSPLAHYGLSCIPRKGALMDNAVQSGLQVKGPRTARRRLGRTLCLTITSFMFSLPRKVSALYKRHNSKLDRKRTRHVTVTQNLLHPKDVLLLSRPASSLSDRARGLLLTHLSSRLRNGALLLVDRQRAVTRLYASII